jgi:hypothetical protein
MGGIEMSKYFKPEEFACPCCGATSASPELLALLDRIRGRWGGPIRVVSGYRCPTYNEVVRGAKNSQHLRGTAADIQPVSGGVDALDTVSALAEILNEKGGVGHYLRFVHVDVRGKRARWNTKVRAWRAGEHFGQQEGWVPKMITLKRQGVR